MIHIIGTSEFAITRIWSILCKSMQWLPYIEAVINNLSVKGDGVVVENTNGGVIDLAKTSPFGVCDINLPSSETGYVYLIVSTVNLDRSYIGETSHIGQRLNEHNIGYGSVRTASAMFLPYSVAAYLTNMSHMDTGQRMSLE